MDETLHEAGPQLEALAQRLAEVGVQPTPRNLSMLQAMIIVQAQASGMSRESLLAWVGGMYESIAADHAAARANGKMPR